MAASCENLWRSSNVPECWKKTSILSIFKKGKNKDLRICRPVSLTAIPGKILKHISKESIYKYLEDSKVISNIKYEFVKCKPFLTYLISFYNKITGFVEDSVEDGIYVIYQGLRTFFD